MAPKKKGGKKKKKASGVDKPPDPNAADEMKVEIPKDPEHGYVNLCVRPAILTLFIAPFIARADAKILFLPRAHADNVAVNDGQGSDCRIPRPHRKYSAI